jgi:long-subunit acyl-CoA synthetase (AMP-forming)
MGYYKNVEANAAALEGEWLHTGDIAIVEENGSIYIVDRLKVFQYSDMRSDDRN